MPTYQDNSKNNSPIGSNKDIAIEGLDLFKKNLEKHFFSEITISICSSEICNTKLIIELNCNLSLVETLFHFNKGTWGNFSCDQNSFAASLQKLKASNSGCIEIEEFSIFLEDTAIIITNIYENSIPEQLDTIISEIGNQYVHFTKKLTEIPYEIYLPVFEEPPHTNDIMGIDIQTGRKGPNNYFSFWGLYFFSENDAVIYDLENSRLISGELYMLNR